MQHAAHRWAGTGRGTKHPVLALQDQLGQNHPAFAGSFAFSAQLSCRRAHHGPSEPAMGQVTPTSSFHHAMLEKKNTSKLGEKVEMEVTCHGMHCVVLGVTTHPAPCYSSAYPSLR